MTVTNLRRAEDADAVALTALAHAAYAGYLPRMGGQRPGPMNTDYAQLVATAEVWVAEQDVGEIVGFVAVATGDDGIVLENVAVHPQWQGSGLGRKLLDLAEERARAAGADSISLYTHVSMVENQRWYASRGYAEVARRTDDGLTRVFYEKRLGA